MHLSDGFAGKLRLAEAKGWMLSTGTQGVLSISAANERKAREKLGAVCLNAESWPSVVGAFLVIPALHLVIQFYCSVRWCSDCL